LLSRTNHMIGHHTTTAICSSREENERSKERENIERFIRKRIRDAI
jgi:hypothetical protein